MARQRDDLGTQGAALNPDSLTPLYVQLLERFRQMIESKELQPGDRFPAELGLVKQYGVARITVRRAISELVREGLLTRARAKGSFVAAAKIDRELVNVASFTERMRARGLRVGSKVIAKAILRATSRVAEGLALAEGAPVVEIQRVRYANREPAALETSYVSLDRCPGIDKVNFNRRSLYQVLDERYGLRPARSRKTLELTFATDREARLLKVAVSAPLFHLTTTVSTADSEVVEYANLFFRGDRFRFEV